MLIRGLIGSLKRELRAIVVDRLYLSSVVILPVVMIIFFGIMFYRGAIDNLPIVVVDRDNSVMSRKLRGMIDASAGVDIAFQAQSINEAESLMLGGEVLAILYIDDGFEQSIYRGVTTSVECYLSGTNLSASGIIERDVQQAVQLFSKGVALEKLQMMGVGYSQAMVDIMPIRVSANIVSNPYLNYGYYLAPIFMIMGVIIFTMLSTIYAIGRELRYGTAKEWMVTACDSLLGGVIGKLLPTTIVMLLLSQLIYAILFMIMGMECAGSYLYLSIATLLLILAYQSIATLFVALTSNMRLALSLGGGYAVMAFTFSGVTFPTMAMYSVARGLSYLFPLTYFSDIFTDQAMRGVPIEYDAIKMLCIALFISVVPLSWRRIHSVVENKEYWGRE